MLPEQGRFRDRCGTKQHQSGKRPEGFWNAGGRQKCFQDRGVFGTDAEL